MAADDDDELLADLANSRRESAKKARPLVPDSRGPTAPMRRLMLGVRIAGVLLGGAVSVVGLMAIAGAVTESLLVRALFAVLVVTLVPGFLADRALRMARGGGLGLVADVVAMTVLALAIGIVAVGPRTSRLLVEEGDRHARAGSRALARFSYFVAGVSPTFPPEGDDAEKKKP